MCGAQRFYLLMSDEAVSIPPELASEMTAYDPTSGSFAPTTPGSSTRLRFDAGPNDGSRPRSRCGPRRAVH